MTSASLFSLRKGRITRYIIRKYISLTLSFLNHFIFFSDFSPRRISERSVLMPRQAEEVLQYDDFLGWTVSSLKDFLSLRGLKQTGLKSELVARAFGAYELLSSLKCLVCQMPCWAHVCTVCKQAVHAWCSNHENITSSADRICNNCISD